jgi:hypothetical protein
MLAVLVAKNNKLEREYESLRQNYEDVIDDSEASHKEITFLKNQTQRVKIEPEEALQSELSESKKLVDNFHSLNSTSTQVESDKVITRTTHPPTHPHHPTTTTFKALPDNVGS